MTAPITKAELARRRGVSRGAVTRACAPGGALECAVLDNGRLDPTHPAVHAYAGGSGKPDLRRYVGPPYFASDFVKLPSGIPLSWPRWRTLRDGTEREALEELDVLIARWRLTPHSLVPDDTDFEPLTLPSGTIVSRGQWLILRGGTAFAAAAALDVLTRSYQEDPDHDT